MNVCNDYVLEKDDLILLWMAEGFLHISATNKSMERLDVEKNVWNEAFKKYRHMSFACDKCMTYNKFKAFERANSLRTFLAIPNVVGNVWQIFFLSSKVLDDILLQLPLLRVLSLSRLNIDEVPECVGNMKHLRYLNLSGTEITHLPEFVCNLYNLQTLIVSGCRNISIDGLDKVQSARDIREVNLSQKRVSELRVEWSEDFNGARNESLENEVLNALKPHSDNVKVLSIVSYGGKVFPNWIGNPSFLLLTCVRIKGCRKCTFLPPLGQLPSLKELYIQSLNEVKVVGSEFLGT
nr:NB-ARC domains-containing protein [Tanacetum cinerariifolium]